MQGNPDIDVLMIPTKKAIKKYVRDRDAFTEIYNRAYEAVMISMEAKEAERAEWKQDAERLATENAELHEQLRWRSVTEEPETGQWVFVSRGRSRFADIFIYDRKLSDLFRRYDLWLPIPPQQFGSFPDCPITLHRQLCEKYEVKDE